MGESENPTKSAGIMKTGAFWGVKLSVLVIIMYVWVAIFGPMMANDKPLYCKVEGKITFPFLKNTIAKTDGQGCISALIPYGPQTTNINGHASLSPGSYPTHGSGQIHWLGTDKLGRDTAAGLIHGTRISLMIGFLSVIFTFFVGTSLGMAAAYYSVKGLELHIIQYIVLLAAIFIGGFYFIYEWIFSGFLGAIWIAFGVVLVFGLLLYTSGKIFFKLPKYRLNLDRILMKIITWRKSFPSIFLLLALTAVFVIPSVWNIVLIITILGWTEFARHARAETMAIMEENYITSARIMGFSDYRIMVKHILPNIMPTLVVLVCFSVSGSILAESTISFLGIGLPVETVTWGKMMASGRDMQQWWLVVFPGIAIMLIIMSLNTIANHFLEKNRTNQ
jgi:peptide/nickel transport system permease protein